MPLLEIACFNEESALVACNAGANRIELCLNQEVGGTTPSREMCRRVVDIATPRGIPVNLMIRPRGGNFVYSEEEYDTMISDLLGLREYASGFVFGILTENAGVDVNRTQQLVDMAHSLPCTFHRAFDHVLDKSRAVEDIIQTGCAAILSAGGMADSYQGRFRLAELQRQFQSRIKIIVGGGLRVHNAQAVHNVVQGEWYHTSALVRDMLIANRDEICNITAALK